MKRIAIGTIAIATLLFSGCSASKIVNTGDERSARISPRGQKKQKEVTRMLKDQSGADPQSEGAATRASTQITANRGHPDSKISAAPH